VAAAAGMQATAASQIPASSLADGSATFAVVPQANLLFTPDWRLKVCDYGVSICLYEERAVTRTGSRDYMAPVRDRSLQAAALACEPVSEGRVALLLTAARVPHPQEVHVCPLKRTPGDNKDSDVFAYGAAADIWSVRHMLATRMYAVACSPAIGSFLLSGIRDEKTGRCANAILTPYPLTCLCPCIAGRWALWSTNCSWAFRQRPATRPPRSPTAAAPCRCPSPTACPRRRGPSSPRACSSAPATAPRLRDYSSTLGLGGREWTALRACRLGACLFSWLCSVPGTPCQLSS
jgi:hypothetical protein